MANVALATNTLMNRDTWSVMREQAAVLVDSGMLPGAIRTKEAGIAVMMKGHELGMPPMQAFAHISIIQGKPTLSPEGMLALIWKNIPSAVINFITIENEICHIEASRPNRPATSFKFTKADATLAGLWGKDNWRKYPRAMCRSRCVAEMARTLFPDAIMGCSYTPEEIEPDVIYSDEGGFEQKPPVKPAAAAAVAAEPGDSSPAKCLFNYDKHWKSILTACSMDGNEPYAGMMVKALEGFELDRDSGTRNNENVRKIHHDVINDHAAIVLLNQTIANEVADEHPELRKELQK